MATRTIFMGSDTFSLPVFERLADEGPSLLTPIETVAAVTQPDRPIGRGRHVASGPIKLAALQRSIPVLQPERVRMPDAVAAIREYDPELIVVASFGQILPPALLQIPRHKCLNLHPSLLPYGRGPTPVATAILDGLTQTGTTLMLMTEGMDAGPILAQEETPLSGTETEGELRGRLALLSAELLVRLLPGWLLGKLQPVAQDDGHATYTRRFTKADGRLDWSESAETLSRRVRAFNPWPGAHTDWEGRRLTVHRAVAVEGSSEPGRISAVGDRPAVGTSAGLLVLTEVQLAGGRPMPADAFLRGYPSLVGACLQGVPAWS